MVEAAGAARPSPRSGPETRARVIQAAIDCILEEGYYRASSNRIAERAEVSWGVIRHHFGTRDRLLLAVLAELHSRLVSTLHGAPIEGGTPRERLASFIGILFSYYRSPEYLVGLQITLNLAREPATRADTLDALNAMSDIVPSELGKIFGAVFPEVESDSDLRWLIFEIIRGVSIGLGIEDALHGERLARPENHAAVLAEALSGILP